jgi:predicted metalloprotease with PDZ domain
MSSFDTWIKFYRPDENSVNTAISYYTKGAVAAFLLDARVRAATGGARSLDDVMRLALVRNPVERGFTPADFRTAASAVAGTDLSAWFARVFDSTAELDYGEALRWFGLRFATEPAGERAWLGAETKAQDGRLIVTEVPRGTPAGEAGLDTDDEIVGYGDFRVRPDEWEHALSSYRPGARLSLLIARRGRLMHLDVTLGREPDRGWILGIDPTSTAEQIARRGAWL